MGDEDTYLAGYRPTVIVPSSRDKVIIHFERVDQTPEGPRRSGKFVHLALTPTDAMRLLRILQTAQRENRWPDFPGEPITTHVPPAKDRS